MLHRTIKFKPFPPKSAPPSVLIPSVQTLTKRFVANLNTFISTCPSLNTIHAPKSAPHTTITGPSVIAPQITELVIATPLLICQDKSLAKAFPKVTKLVLREHEPYLLLVSGREGCETGECKPDRWSALQHIFSGDMQEVKELELELMIAGNQPWAIKWRMKPYNWIEKRNIRILLGKFPKLEKLTLRFTALCLDGALPYDLVNSKLFGETILAYRSLPSRSARLQSFLGSRNLKRPSSPYTLMCKISTSNL